VSEHREIRASGGRILHAYATTAPAGRSALTVFWHHGSPHTGVLLEPLVRPAMERDIRVVTYARPSYGGSTPHPGRGVAAAADDVAAVAEAFGLDRFAVMGGSGGGPHALACAALLGDRVTAAVTFASPAPYDGTDDWFAGMASPGALRSATEGRGARTRYAENADADPDAEAAIFTDADLAALEGPWAALGADAGAANDAHPEGRVDDDVAFVSPWGFEPAGITVPVLLVHGADDRMVPVSHADRLARAIAVAEVWRKPTHGHVSVMAAYPDALDWLLQRR
jgi:pimeloyl-ACP methyl ester carboxylesterase